MTDVTTAELAARLGEPGLVLLDVRGRAEYSGALGAPCDPRRGHVPGARNLDVQDLLGLGSGRVRALVGADEGAEVIAYCHSGQRSALAAEILRAAGYRARNYPGSWHEWSSDPTCLSTGRAGDRPAMRRSSRAVRPVCRREERLAERAAVPVPGADAAGRSRPAARRSASAARPRPRRTSLSTISRVTSAWNWIPQAWSPMR